MYYAYNGVSRQFTEIQLKLYSPKTTIDRKYNSQKTQYTELDNLQKIQLTDNTIHRTFTDNNNPLQNFFKYM